MKKKKIYSREVEKEIERQIPSLLIEAMDHKGWNVFGIYELVKEELAKEKKRKILYRRYNYPWSGRLGAVATRCIYCGDDGPSFQLSSQGASCTQCIGRKKPIPELEKEYLERCEQLAEAWCVEHGIDYAATVKNLLEKVGPMDQVGPPSEWPEINVDDYIVRLKEGS